MAYAIGPKWIFDSQLEDRHVAKVLLRKLQETYLESYSLFARKNMSGIDIVATVRQFRG